MFTSRAEYRLLLREDNADLRLAEKGHLLGLVSEADYMTFQRKREMIAADYGRLCSTRLEMDESQVELLSRHGCSDIQKGITLEQLLRRPEISYADLAAIDDVSRETASNVSEQVEIQIKYRGYIERQLEQVERSHKLENTKLPDELDYYSITGLTTEVREKLAKTRPDTLGQASRIPGVTPAAISVLAIAVKAKRWKSHEA